MSVALTIRVGFKQRVTQSEADGHAHHRRALEDKAHAKLWSALNGLGGGCVHTLACSRPKYRECNQPKHDTAAKQVGDGGSCGQFGLRL